MISPGTPTIIIVGGDALTLSAARDICELHDHRVVVLWPADAEFASAVQDCGAELVVARPENREALAAAGVGDAIAILALAPNEELNLQVALRARDANPKIRIVLRQFNRTLAAKIEQNLSDCSALSLAWHSAPTYAAAALDPTCFRGLQFPEPDGPLTGFAVRTADRDQTVEKAEAVFGVRIIAVDGETVLRPDDAIAAGATLIVYGTVQQLLETAPGQLGARSSTALRVRLRDRVRRRYRLLRRTDPYSAVLATAALLLFALGTLHFHESFGSKWLVAAYFVISTMTTTGYGDITPNHNDDWDVTIAMLLMLLGTVLTGIFIAIVASRLTRAQWVHMQGLRPIRRNGHIVVCGCGSIGGSVIDLLLQFSKQLVVVEATPDAALVERARDRGFDLLTGDASRDDTLDLCNLGAAHSLIALTNVDTRNLEIALGARARNPNMPIVLRIAEASFAASIASHFQFETTFSVAALAGPVFAGLARLPGARGRIALDGQDFGIAEITLPENVATDLPPVAIPLAVVEHGEFGLVRSFEKCRPGAQALALLPLAPFRDGRERA
jgi:voltage-gated potassium channel Kch